MLCVCVPTVHVPQGASDAKLALLHADAYNDLASH